MIRIFKNELDNEIVKRIDKIEDNCWINLVNPTSDEIKLVVDTLQIDEDLITKVLDEEELPRIEKTDNATLIEYVTVENCKNGISLGNMSSATISCAKISSSSGSSPCAMRS